jgi:hypothetical protein
VAQIWGFFGKSFKITRNKGKYLLGKVRRMCEEVANLSTDMKKNA